jgi:hypothetical protein
LHSQVSNGTAAAADRRPDDRASRGLVDAALTALSRLATAAAEATAARRWLRLLIHRPESFLRAIAAEAGLQLGRSLLPA